MTDPAFSALWYRVAALKPRLRDHLTIDRHHYRNRLWYVICNETTGRHHRFSQDAHQLIGLMDGERTLQNIWAMAAGTLGDEVPTQDETIRLLGQLHMADLIQTDIAPDIQELLQRAQQQQRKKRQQKFRNPLALRIPMADPDRLLQRLLPLARLLFNRWTLSLWLLVVISAGLLAWMHWRELTTGAVDRIFTAQNLLILWICYPLVKLLHETGHAMATRLWGGAVHEIGLTLLALMPVPYVDASAASSFPDKQRRILVGAAGIMVELFLAALSLFVWLAMEPGVLRAAAFNIMLIGGVSTLLFNGNPLLRFDAYYILADAVEIPNLSSRANRYYLYLVQRYLFGVKNLTSPANAPGEAVWFLFYGAAAFIYRIFILFAIIIFIGGKFFFIGILIALWAFITLLLMPIGKFISFLASDNRLNRHRARSVFTTAAITSLILGALFFYPVPLRTHAEGVIWPPEDARIRAGTDCFIEQVIAREGTLVNTAEPLINCVTPFLEAHLKVLIAREKEIKARVTAEEQEERVKAQILREELEVARANLRRVQEEAEQLTILSPTNGRLLLLSAEDLPGRFITQGSHLGYVLDLSRPSVRVAIDQDEIGLMRGRIDKIEVKLAHAPDETFQAKIIRETPAASHRLPSMALGSAGGGRFAVDPADKEGVKALEPIFVYDLSLRRDMQLTSVGAYAGERAYVRFGHGAEPLFHRWYRDLRRLFLSKFDV